jgi:hypothetical protein
MALTPARLPASGLAVEHRLAVELVPAERRLIGRDEMRIQTDDRPELFFFLSERVIRLHVEVEGRPRKFRFTASELVLPVAADERQRAITVSIRYEARFDDPVPVSPLNTDNPGFGVSATISETGVFLMPGAGWYPDPADGSETFHVTVKAPRGMLAVTAGQNLGHRDLENATVSEWRVDHPVRGLALSAAAYRLGEEKFGAVTVAAYFLPPNQELAPAYLEAAAGYLKLYSERFGPYPFPKFAVVENFFPTGYGFASYTLIGGTVLRLPFIIQTSLGHEIAHCWWGNGVQVDYDAGNWSEALTTYVADYFYRENESPAAAADYRRNALLNYATLVPPAKDQALARFAARIDPATKAIGYDKGAMVFHMLRRMIGEEAFWGGLRDIFRDSLFKEVSWSGLRMAFEKRAGRSLTAFFEQWVSRRGAPQLRLEAVNREQTADGWRVTGRLVQAAPAFDLELDLSLETGTGTRLLRLAATGKSTAFEMTSPAVPLRLAVDPDHHLMRRLELSEIPPTVNALKSSPSVLFLTSGRLPSAAAGRLADTLARALGVNPVAIVPEADAGSYRLEDHDLVWVGYPRDSALLGSVPEGLAVGETGYSLKGEEHTRPTDILFGVLRHPTGSGRVLALFLPLSLPGAETVAAKVTHYGRFSFLSFRDGQNTAKGVWPVADTPVDYRWPKTAN